MNAASAVSRVPAEFPRNPEWHELHEPTISERIRNHGFATISVMDNRMFPWIRRGDLVFIRRIDFDAAKAGDSILFERGSRVVLRRVLRRAKEAEYGGAGALVVKSYAHGRRQEFVASRRFLGRAIRIHRRRKHIDMESFERIALAKGLAGFSNLKRMFGRPLQSLKTLLFA